MLKLFKKKSERERLEDQYQKLLEESFRLSKLDRTQADLKAAEADQVLKKIESLEQGQ